MYDVLQFRKQAQTLTNLTFSDYYYRLMLLARSRFEWKNLPNGIEERWIEKYLFTEGDCLFFEDQTMGLMVTKATHAGNLNAYDEPTKLKPYGTNYNGKVYTNNVDCVLIQNNDCGIPTHPTIELYASRLAELSRTIDINVNAQKTPVVILCSEQQRKTVKTVFNQWNGFEPLILGDKDLDLNGFKAMNTQAPIVFDKLQLQKHAVWNECMTFLGIANANQDKKERLVTDEVNANNNQIELAAQLMLKSRQQAAEKINAMFGTNITVELREVNNDVMKVSERLEVV